MAELDPTTIQEVSVDSTGYYYYSG